MRVDDGFPCQSCSYVAKNRRILARHDVLNHSERTFKCPLCPFITQYAANWYRHKRDLHGLTKFTTCDMCEFYANSTEELAHHKETNHPEKLQLAKYKDKYAKERERLKEEPCDNSFDMISSTVQENGRYSDPNTSLQMNSYSRENLSANNDSLNYSQPLNNLSSEFNLQIVKSEPLSPKPTSPIPSEVNSLNSSPVTLGPLKVRRSYYCDPCSLMTNDPREYLYHCKEVHGEKIIVRECKYCIYASRHVQKLQRHCNLTHREQMLNDPEYQQQLEASKERKGKRKAVNATVDSTIDSSSAIDSTGDNNIVANSAIDNTIVFNSTGDDTSVINSPVNTDFANSPLVNSTVAMSPVVNSTIPELNDIVTVVKEECPPPAGKVTRKRTSNSNACTGCSYHTRNKSTHDENEEEDDQKNKFFQCSECGYTTSVKGSYTKHIKQHSAIKLKCDFCFFETTYKWNLNKHMKSHETRDGQFKCMLCKILFPNRESVKLHFLVQHKNINSVDNTQDENVVTHTTDPIVISIKKEHNDNDIGSAVAESPQTSSFINENYSTDTSKSSNATKKHLKCKLCEFTAVYPSQMKRHEESHKSLKKHSCPLCDMRFEHIAWLTKHLRRVHKDNPQAKSMAANLDRLKPGRKKPIKKPSVSSIPPSFPDRFKQATISVNQSQEKPKSSMLSSLLKTPMHPLPSFKEDISHSTKEVPLHSTPVKTIPDSRQTSSKENKNNTMNMNILQHVEKTNLTKTASPVYPVKVKGHMSCSVCGYKSRWSSELQRHMRVHSQDKPFQCHKCKYHCKWKGDLNRHLLKYHNIKPINSKKGTVPKLKLKKSNTIDTSDNWQTVNQDITENTLPQSNVSENEEQDIPLDLTLSKSNSTNSSNPNQSMNISDSSQPLDQNNDTNEESDATNFTKGEDISSNYYLGIENIPFIEASQSATGKRNYKCPYCDYNTTTASRFHAHIVQHYNKRPFMCSICGYNSNWEWDITKHIKQKGCKDKIHANACVLLTDEAGKRNYMKYEKYLVGNPELAMFPKDAVDNQVDDTTNVNSNSTNVKNCSYDFKNIGSNFEETPVSIVVTPDINLPDSQEITENQNMINFEGGDNAVNVSGSAEPSQGSKLFYCKHCDFKSNTKRDVIGHLSVHAGLKPYRCRACGLTSNWRHVIVKHVKDTHNGYMHEVEERIAFVQEGYSIRLTAVYNDKMNGDGNITKTKKSLYGCKLCPYKCDRPFYVTLHMKQHTPRDGAKHKCTFCPYYVKFKKTLVRHLKLHKDPVRNENKSSSSENNHKNIPEINKNDKNKTDHSANPEHEAEACANNERQTSSNAATLVNGNLSAEAHAIGDVYSNAEMYINNGAYSNTQANIESYSNAESRSNALTFDTSVTYANDETHPDLSTYTDTERYANAARFVNAETYINDVYAFDENDAIEESVAISFERLSQSDSAQYFPPKIKRHVCENCPYKTDNKTQYLYHKQFHRPNLSAPFKCSICSYWATMQHLLTQHMKVHSESSTEDGNTRHQKSYEANAVTNASKESVQPNPDFPEKISVVHVKRGNDIIKMFKCDFCPMTNKKKANVRLHQRMHGVIVNGGKFACTFCNYQCLNQGGLTNHIKIHRKNPENLVYLEHNGITQKPVTLDKHISIDGANQVRKHVFSYFCMKCPALFKSYTDLQSHVKFHGCSLPFPCPHCDYRARNKPHLCKHITVHSPEYISKRNASNGPPVNSGNASNHTEASPPELKKVDQMLLLEAAEVKSGLMKSKSFVQRLKCTVCPALFVKSSTLSYHLSMHSSGGQYTCSHCDYSTNRLANITTHNLLHSKDRPLRRPQKTFQCPKCPAVFYKLDRYERHISLHGKNYKFICDQCDYSVRFAANLVKHKNLHDNVQESINITNSQVSSSKLPTFSEETGIERASSMNLEMPVNENMSTSLPHEERKAYICDRCPYVQHRKDAVQSHQRRHWLKDGFKCLHCDYSSMQNSYLREHTKLHFQPNRVNPAKVFARFEQYELIMKVEGKEIVIFDSKNTNPLPKRKDEKNASHCYESDKDIDRDFVTYPTDKMGADSESSCNSSIQNSKLPSLSPIVLVKDIFCNRKELKKWMPNLSNANNVTEQTSKPYVSRAVAERDPLQHNSFKITDKHVMKHHFSEIAMKMVWKSKNCSVTKINKTKPIKKHKFSEWLKESSEMPKCKFKTSKQNVKSSGQNSNMSSKDLKRLKHSLEIPRHNSITVKQNIAIFPMQISERPKSSKKNVNNKVLLNYNLSKAGSRVDANKNLNIQVSSIKTSDKSDMKLHFSELTQKMIWKSINPEFSVINKSEHASNPSSLVATSSTKFPIINEKTESITKTNSSDTSSSKTSGKQSLVVKIKVDDRNAKPTYSISDGNAGNVPLNYKRTSSSLVSCNVPRKKKLKKGASGLSVPNGIKENCVGKAILSTPNTKTSNAQCEKNAEDMRHTQQERNVIISQPENIKCDMTSGETRKDGAVPVVVVHDILSESFERIHFKTDQSFSSINEVVIRS